MLRGVKSVRRTMTGSGSISTSSSESTATSLEREGEGWEDVRLSLEGIIVGGCDSGDQSNRESKALGRKRPLKRYSAAIEMFDISARRRAMEILDVLA